MREIKFRAWHRIEKRMFDCQSLFFSVESRLIGVGEHARGKVWAVGEEVEVIESTGLTDKNGKNFWDGDVIQFSDSDGRKSQVSKVSIILPTGLDLEYADGWHYDYLKISRQWEYVEVIGNIYEHPDLLSKKGG